MEQGQNFVLEAVYEVQIRRRSQDYNSNNHHDMSPFFVSREEPWIEGSSQVTLFLAHRFYDHYLSSFTREFLHQKSVALRFSISLFESLEEMKSLEEREGQRVIRNLDDSIYFLMYRCYIDQWDYECYATEALFRNFLPSHLEVVSLTSTQCQGLRDCTQIRLLRKDPSFRSTDISSCPPDLVRRIVEVMDHLRANSSGNGVFVKLSRTSGKNEIPLSPKFSASQVLDFLTSKREFLRYYDSRCFGSQNLKDQTEDSEIDLLSIIGLDLFDGQLSLSEQPEEKTGNQNLDPDSPQGSLILMPWNEEISSENEYRVLVQEWQVRAISPQKWFSRHDLSHDSARAITRAIVSLVRQIETHTETSPSPPFQSGVWDVYFSQRDGQAHLIEINPWGSFGSSGSACFHWIRDSSICEDPQLYFYETSHSSSYHSELIFRYCHTFSLKETLSLL